VTLTYDAAGNRKTMTDGLGSVSYAYNLGNEVTSITNPFSVQVGYNYDKIGRPTGVTGSGYGGVSSYVSSMSYRTFGLKQMNYSNGRTLSLQYDNRMRLTNWSIPSVLRVQYLYEGTNGGRVEFARNQDDETLDRYFGYDHVGRLTVSRSGNEARLAIGEQVPLLYNGPYSHGYQYDQWGNITYREGWGGDNPVFTASYTNNKRNGLTYDAAGNLTNDGGLNYTYDATGQQATASYTGYLLQQYYDGNGLRAKKVDGGVATYYLRSSVLGGQVVAEIGSSGTLQRGYVYLGGQLLAVQQSNAVSWVHQDPFVKSKRVTNGSGAVVSTIELDPWGGNTNRNNNEAFQPQAFTTYTRDGIAADDAMFRRYNRWWSRFDQPDPYLGSYNLTDPQSFNRYSYVRNDPVNLVDPMGLMPCVPGNISVECDSSGFGGWGGGFGGGTGWGHDPRPGLGVIGAAERSYNRQAFRFLPIDEATALPLNFQTFTSWLGISWQPLLQEWTVHKPTKQEIDYLNCLRTAFKAAREADRQNAANNQFAITPDAASVVSAGIGVVGGLLLMKSPVGAVLGGLLVGGAVGIAKDVVSANIVRGAKRVYHSSNISLDLNQKVNDCNEKSGRQRSMHAVTDAQIVYGASLYQ